MISFVIPAHQEEQHIAKTIHSVLQNSWKIPPEIIVIENASSDGTYLSAQKSGATVYHLDKQGRSSARNFGASKATGEWIIFLDSDVVLDKNWSLGFYKAIEKPWNEVIQGPIVPSSYQNNWLARYRSKWGSEKTNDSFCSFLSDAPLPILNSACFAIKKKTFDALGGFDENLKRCEDIDFGFRLFFKGYIFFVEPSMKSSVYWNHGGFRYLKRFYQQGQSVRQLELKWKLDLSNNGRRYLTFPRKELRTWMNVIVCLIEWLGWKKEFLESSNTNCRACKIEFSHRNIYKNLHHYWGWSDRWFLCSDSRLILTPSKVRLFYFDSDRSLNSRWLMGPVENLEDSLNQNSIGFQQN